MVVLPSAITFVSFNFADNLLSFPTQPYVDNNGISFESASAMYVIFSFGCNCGPGFGYAMLARLNSGSGVEPNISLEATPLPAALPLFATGLGALGLLGRRRKRKAQAVA